MVRSCVYTMVTYKESLTKQLAPDRRGYGGVLVSEDEFATVEIEADELVPHISEVLDTELVVEEKFTQFVEGELVYMEGKLSPDTTKADTEIDLAGLYRVRDVNQPTQKGRRTKQFRVLEDVSGDHWVVVHQSGKAYQIPVDTKYPCTHRDVPKDELIPFSSFEKYGQMHYKHTSYQLPTEWLIRIFGGEAEYLSQRI